MRRGEQELQAAETQLQHLTQQLTNLTEAWAVHRMFSNAPPSAHPGEVGTELKCPQSTLKA